MIRVLMIALFALGLLNSMSYADMDGNMKDHMSDSPVYGESDYKSYGKMGPGMMGYGGYGSMGYGMGPGGCGMMGYGMGAGMMGDHRMRHGNMGNGMMGFGMGPGMWGYDAKTYDKFLNDTVEMRRELHNRHFDYNEALLNRDVKRDDLIKMEKDMLELQMKIKEKWWNRTDDKDNN